MRGWIDEVDGISGVEPLGKNMMVTLSGFGTGDAVGEAVGEAFKPCAPKLCLIVFEAAPRACLW